LEDELTDSEHRELSKKIKYYSDMVLGVVDALRFEFADSKTIEFLIDAIHLILFDRSDAFIVYLDGYDKQLGIVMTTKGIEQIGNLNSLYDSIRIKSTQGEVFTLNDYYNACLTFWYKIK
jgi:hypothetical protein